MMRAVAALIWIAFTLAGAWAPPAYANASGWSAGTTGRPLAVCIRPARPGDDPRAIVRDLAGFDCATPQQQFGPGDFWVVSQPIGERSRSRRPLAARIGSVWQERVTLHVLYADGRMRIATTQNTSRRIQIGAVVEDPLPRLPVAVDRLLWKIEGSANMRGILINPRLATQAESHRANLAMTLLYGAFGGLCIALLVYNLALWASLRHRFQLAYGLMIAALMAYAVTSSGALAWAMPDIDNNIRLRINYLLLSIAAASALWFARTFFETHIFGPRLRRLIRWTIAALLLTGAAVALFAPLTPRLFDAAYSWVFVGTFVTVAAIIVSAWRRRSNFLWLFAIAWAAPILAAGMRVFASLGLIPWSFLLDNSTLLSMAAEALISSVAIAYRIRLLSRERDQAVAAETVARRLADIDPLTGLLNRRAFLGQAIGRHGPQTLLVLDLDHFKQVNETIGHDGGDEVLRIVARTLRALAPPNALIARVGGEEFAVVTDAAHPLDPEGPLDRLRSTRMPFDLPVTASIGTATGPLANEKQWKALYRAADRALFAAKAAGRDRAKAA
ncbi:diguanylate cyclase [Sphingomonas suaedae]|uniref:diguanylate cyclase n=1 Tax=Sphingomonas suaedae TaxID=2599297 RepID=A0A518RF04_9SPHN|nr:diguanylate cyclase [Sphingomonas suaedae]QDX26047.1 diguanylate cyclase [Sphingomonas suaedae]